MINLGLAGLAHENVILIASWSNEDSDKSALMHRPTAYIIYKDLYRGRPIHVSPKGTALCALCPGHTFTDHLAGSTTD